MPSTSKSQQRLFCMAYAVRKGELERNKVTKSVLDIADGDMTDEEIKDFMELKENRIVESFENFIKESYEPVDVNKLFSKMFSKKNDFVELDSSSKYASDQSPVKVKLYSDDKKRLITCECIVQFNVPYLELHELSIENGEPKYPIGEDYTTEEGDWEVMHESFVKRVISRWIVIQQRKHGEIYTKAKKYLDKI